MTSQAGERLYKLLPAVYRLRDAEEELPFRALFSLIEAEFLKIEADVEQLYNDAFIETCEEWVVPYIGDLLSVRGLHEASEAYSQRAYVANTLAYRRRKGTAFVLEQLARDVTAWPARAVEFFERLVATQNMNHIRADNIATLDLHKANALELLNGPLESAKHVVDVRHIASGRGRYNIPNIGLFLWRLKSYRIMGVDAYFVGPVNSGRYTFSPLRFDPLGIDMPLFNVDHSERDIVSLAGEEHVPGRLRRRPLSAILEEQHKAGAKGDLSDFGIRVTVDGQLTMESGKRLEVCDLSVWHQAPADKVLVDPIRGRLAVAGAKSVQVDYAYGFSGDIGGGPYDRTPSLKCWFGLSLAEVRDRITWQTGVAREVRAADRGDFHDSLASAISAWDTYAGKTGDQEPTGLIAVTDNRTHPAPGRTIEVPAGMCLILVAADWQADTPSEGTEPSAFQPGKFVLQNGRPHVRGDVRVRGIPPVDDTPPGTLILDGLLVEGRVIVEPGSLGRLVVVDSTIVSDISIEAAVDADPQKDNARLRVEMIRSISGAVRLPPTVTGLCIRDCIVDARRGTAAIDAPDSDLEIDASTVFGTVRAGTLSASNVIFTDHVLIERRQTGCVRFSFVANGAPQGNSAEIPSRTPRRHRCLPDMALAEQAALLGRNLGPAERDAVIAGVTPAFTSRDPAHPAYAQLSRTCAETVRAGADDGSEMGVFGFLRNHQREANLLEVLDEYLRFGLEAGIHFVT